MSFNIDFFVEQQQAFLKVFDVPAEKRQAIEVVVRKGHVGDGYFSMDGIYDDMCEILGTSDRTRRLYNGMMAYSGEQ